MTPLLHTLEPICHNSAQPFNPSISLCKSNTIHIGLQTLILYCRNKLRELEEMLVVKVYPKYDIQRCVISRLHCTGLNSHKKIKYLPLDTLFAQNTYARFSKNSIYLLKYKIKQLLS